MSVAIADDLFRVGLSNMLAREGIEVSSAESPDAIVVDARSEDIGSEWAGCTVALCDPGEDAALAALRRGASAVVERGDSPAAIADAIRAAAAGAAVMPAGVAARLLESEPAPAADATADRLSVESLSPREREVLSLLTSGLENDEIARELVVSTSTVKNHMARIMLKLGARNRTHAAVIALTVAGIAAA